MDEFKESTVLIQRANVILSIPESQSDYYLSQGYNLIDENGTVLKASIPNDIGSLQRAYVQHLAEIDRLKKELESKSTGKRTKSAKS